MKMASKVLLGLCCGAVVLSAQNNLKTTVTQRYFAGVRRNLEAAADDEGHLVCGQSAIRAIDAVTQ